MLFALFSLSGDFLGNRAICLALFNRMQGQRYAIILIYEQELRLFFVEKQKK